MNPHDIQLPRCMSGADLIARMDAAGLSVDTMATLSGVDARTLRRHIAYGPDPLPLRVHRMYDHVLSGLPD